MNPTNERSSTERLAGQRALLRFLQQQGRLTADQVAQLAPVAEAPGVSLFQLLEREEIISEKDLANLLAGKLRLRLVDLSTVVLDPEMTRELKENVALRYEVVPLRIENEAIQIATANPLDLDAVKAVEFATGKRVQVLVASQTEITDALAHLYRMQESLEAFLRNVPDEQGVTVAELRDDGADLRSVAANAELPPIVKLADLILIEGIKANASDVHIEPGPDSVAVRYRVDGILEESFRFPKWVQSALTGRLKVMAKLDITERRIPQDGRLHVRHQDRAVDLRVSSLPAQHGEKMTLRILDAGSAAAYLLDRIGLSAADLQRLREVVRRPEGLILVTGPTGSGKTTTLYALLREKFSPNLNIVTIENPIECQLKGINQVEINDKQGLTFASVLRSVLRQDPDVILVGEIRDRETAQIALQAAQTGHLVLSTVHTNDAAAAVTRLLDLGLEPYVLASALHMIVAQRLVRQICKECGTPVPASEESRRLLRLGKDVKLRRGQGCKACRQSGFSGRAGVYEVLPISPTISKIIEAGGTEGGVRQQARREGCKSLMEDAKEKLLAGLTTPEEVLRVVQVEEQERTCPQCAHEVRPDARTCANCGATLAPEASGPGDGRATAGPAGTDSSATPSRTFKALVVDDNATIRELVHLALEQSPYRLSAVVAANGEEALALASAERPDVVILDQEMPGLNGFEVCQRLRSDVRTAFVPMLMLTADGSETSMAKGFAAGLDDYMVKPFRREELVARVGRMLARTYGRAAVGDHPDGAMADRAATSGATAGRAGVSDVSPDAAPASPEDLVAEVRQLDDVREAIRRLEGKLAELSRRVDSRAADADVRTPDPDDIRQTLERVVAEQRQALETLRPQMDEMRQLIEHLRDEHAQLATAVLRRPEASGAREP